MTGAHILGIDPELKGAPALLTVGGELTVIDMLCLEVERGDKSKRQIDTVAVAGPVRRLDLTSVMIERAWAIPVQSVTGMYLFG